MREQKKQEKQEPERQRKAWKHGETTQKAMGFRLDNELQEWLNSKPNKGRYINDLIRADMNQAQD